MKLLLLGAAGQVGLELRGPLAVLGTVIAPTRAALDLGDLDALRALVREHSPDVIVNCAAYNAVDDAEGDFDGALRINREAVAVLGEEAKARKIALVTYSTDYVFDASPSGGAAREGDPANPLNAYGRSKLEGERALLALDAPALIFRTAWVWSVGARGFVSTMLRLAREREILRVVDDQVGNPTFARDLAFATATILHAFRRDPHGAVNEARGVYHLAGATHASRYALAVAAIERDPKRNEHLVRVIEPIPSSAMTTAARRPGWVVLDCQKATERFGVTLPGYLDALGRALV